MNGFVLNKKDIIDLNKEFYTGQVNNEASLDFALSRASKTGNWPKALAYLVRSILIDHVFEEGNKRTTALLIKTYAKLEDKEVYNDKLIKLIKDVVHDNKTDIQDITRLINDAIKNK